jgi:hypothetical protein
MVRRGRRSPAVSVSVVVCPETASATLAARTTPRGVSTPVTAPSGPRRMAVTGVFWCISTPSASAARA